MNLGRIVGGWRHYAFADWATQGYLALVGLLILLFHGQTVPLWRLLLAVHAVLLVGIHLLVVLDSGGGTGRTVRFIRDFYPIPLFIFCYRETGWLNQMFTPTYLDAWAIRADQAIFGFQPGVEWIQRWPSLLFSELMYGAYFSYYLMIAGIGLALLLRDRNQFRHYLAVVCFSFYCCYLFYIAAPVMGPRIFARPPPGYVLPSELQSLVTNFDYPAAVQGGPFFKVVDLIYELFEAPGAAFPSSHVIIAVITAWFSRRYFPSIYLPHVVLVALLCASTVYCRHHYVVDVFAGWVGAALLLWISETLYRRLGDPPGRVRP